MTTATTTARSAYPTPVAELLPQARALAERLGRVPSRNRLMSELKVGARKATAVRTALDAEHQPATITAADPSPTRLHLVPANPEPAPSLTPANDAATADSTYLPGSTPVSETDEPAPAEPVVPEPFAPVATVADPEPQAPATPVRDSGRAVRAWPVLLLALPAFVAIWSGWVGLGGLTGFGIVHPLPGIADEFALNTAITLPIGVETYAAYALRVWLSGHVPTQARNFAKYSALGSLALGALGQVAYHLMTAAGMTHAPWWITTLVACLPVAVLGMGAALTHLLNTDENEAA